ncbi:MAG: helix-turn-helix domain-containing protein, partial [Candidatus Paceibacterota bacterium]
IIIYMISHSIKIKEKAIMLRKKGKSFSQIAKSLKIGKSTVGFWFKNGVVSSKNLKKKAKK